MNLSWVDVIFNLSQMKETHTVCRVGFTVVYFGFLQTKHFQGTNWNKDQNLKTVQQLCCYSSEIKYDNYPCVCELFWHVRVVNVNLNVICKIIQTCTDMTDVCLQHVCVLHVSGMCPCDVFPETNTCRYGEETVPLEWFKMWWSCDVQSQGVFSLQICAKHWRYLINVDKNVILKLRRFY